MRRIPRGFTIIEILVVISVIGILATISLIGFNRFQGDTRDSQRSSQATIISEALEKYYDKNGEYPSCSDLTTPADTVTSNTLVGLQKNVLVAPQAASGTTNSIGCTTLSVSGTDFFEYEGDGSSTCATGASCLAYTLKYKDETDSTIQTIASRRNTDIDTSGSVTLAGTGGQFSSVNLTWNAIDNAADYIIQAASDAAFTIGLSSTTGTGTSGSIGSLTPGNSYYVRIAPHASNGQGDWSNTIFATVPHIANPAAAVSSSGPTSISLTWPAVSGATSYTIERDTSASFSAPQQSTQASPNKTFSDSQPGLTHYFRVKAVAPDDLSGWSTTQSIAPTVPQPTSDPTMSAAMNGTNAEGTTGGTSCAYGTLQYGLRYHSENTGSLGSYSAYTTYGPTTVLSVAALEGYRYVFQAQARCFINSTSSVVRTSVEANVVRQIDNPDVPAYSGATSWYRGSGHAVNYVSYCPSGTSLSAGPSFSGGFRSTGFNHSNGTYYWHGWGYVDSWTFPSGYGPGSTIRYDTNYRCSTTYDTSPNSPTLTHYITIT